MNNNGKPSMKYIITVGFAIFATYFGAGNLIFPPSLGLSSGTLWIAALLGFVLADVGFGVFGIIATVEAGGGVDDMARPIGNWFAVLIGSIICLFIGPLFAVPRVAATTFEVAILPNTTAISPWVFSLIFFAVTFALTVKQLKVVDIIGNILTPVLILMLAIIIIGAIVHPIGTPVDTGAQHQFTTGFKEGYQTMDAIGSVVMAGIFVYDVKARGFITKKQQLSVIIPAGIVSAICLTVIYGGLTYVGASASGVAAFKDLTRVPLLVGTVHAILGSWGTLALGVAVAAACLTTSIGLCSMVANFFTRITHDKLSYKLNISIICVVSFFMSLVGVDGIVNLAVNCLLLIYPVVIVLILMNMFDKFIPHKWAYRGAILMAFLVAAMDVAGAYTHMFDAIRTSMPFANQGFGWIVPSIVGAVVGAIIQMICRIPNPEKPHRPDFE